MHTNDYQRPPTLYRYSQQPWLERALTLGEFRLRPAADDQSASGKTALRLNSASAPSYLTLSFATAFDEGLFNAFGAADACLVIHNPEEFGERLHRAVQRALPNWAGIDGAISYGARSPLGAAFTKAALRAAEHEWQFAWRPMQPTMRMSPIVVKLGSIEAFAEIRSKTF
ncbi:MAG TPA: hypothetical protein VJ752_21145 [Burkholderiaceae bacterium]|nr:hypothetical protein [Burkholderiaceae bacterium]